MRRPSSASPVLVGVLLLPIAFVAAPAPGAADVAGAIALAPEPSAAPTRYAGHFDLREARVNLGGAQAGPVDNCVELRASHARIHALSGLVEARWRDEALGQDRMELVVVLLAGESLRVVGPSPLSLTLRDLELRADEPVRVLLQPATERTLAHQPFTLDVALTLTGGAVTARERGCAA